MKPQDTEYSEFKEFENVVQLACKKCGPRNGDGMVNAADLKTLEAWAARVGKFARVRVLVNDGTGSQWYSIPLADFKNAGYWLHGISRHAYNLVPKERLIPQAQNLEEGSATAKAEDGWVVVSFGSANAKANTIHRAIEAAGLESPFLFDRTNRAYAIKIKA